MWGASVERGCGAWCILCHVEQQRHVCGGVYVCVRVGYMYVGVMVGSTCTVVNVHYGQHAQKRMEERAREREEELKRKQEEAVQKVFIRGGERGVKVWVHIHGASMWRDAMMLCGVPCLQQSIHTRTHTHKQTQTHQHTQTHRCVQKKGHVHKRHRH